MDLSPIFVTAIVFVTIYKIFDLFVRRSERMAIIDKISPDSTNIDLSRLCMPMSAPDSRYNALKIGSLILGLGLGLFIYAMIVLYENSCHMEIDWRLSTTLCSSLVLLGGGLGLLMAFIIENSMRKSAEKNTKK